MDVKEAVKIAKGYVLDVFSEEGIFNLGLEEVESFGDTWQVTLGFSRPWNTVRSTMNIITGEAAPRRSYKIVSISEEGRILSVKQREKSE